MEKQRVNAITKAAPAVLYSLLALFPAVGGELPAAGERNVAERGPLRCDSIPGARFSFGGEIGARIERNIDQWLLTAPTANPGMLGMFRVRDRKPPPRVVPWAGEFAGKYLISAIQTLRMTERPEAERFVARFVGELLSTQAEDGYLGPFPRKERLLGHWDLWGHYHVIQALLLWNERSGNRRSLDAAYRAADLICRTYLDSGRRVSDAGSDEMNMAVIHALGKLYRLSGRERYLRMAREIEKDWERAGDYLRQGLAGTEFYLTPRPRWESLHDIQGLVELFRITGDRRYRKAFTNLWKSIARRDVHNTGGFSSGEKAIGHPYSPAAVETCCTVAWTALTVDMARLTGDPRAADALELATFNAVAGAQHPSGRWWTYNTPMDGAREASAHSIVFQARPGTPELNCCSVNAPRGLGVLSEWAVMRDGEGVIVNYYGPCRAILPWRDGPPLRLEQDPEGTTYPKGGEVLLRVSPAEPSLFPLKLRIPEWSRRTEVRVNGNDVSSVDPGDYLELRRRWTKGDTIAIRFDMRLRCHVGDRDASGRMSICRGPILLAYDQRWNTFDETDLPALDASRVAGVEAGLRPVKEESLLDPWLLVELRGTGGRKLTLCDFATAGATGTRYRSWLPTVNAAPPRVLLDRPAPEEGVGPGSVLFRWSGFKPRSGESSCRLLVSVRKDFSEILVSQDSRENCAVPETSFRDGGVYYWKVVTRNDRGETESETRVFRVDPEREPLSARELEAIIPGPDGLLLAAPLAGSGEPARGLFQDARGVRPAPGPEREENGALRFDGETGRVRYRVAYFPEESYSVAIWVKIESFPRGRFGQIFSAWAAGMDDPLRICVEADRLFARIEAGQGYSTEGVPVSAERWMHVAAVKAESKLHLYLDGELKGSAAVPPTVSSSATNVALGANPNYSGNEYLEATLAEFRLYARALRPEELQKLARTPRRR